MKTCHDIKGMVLNFGSFEIYKSTNFIKEYLPLAAEFLKRNICFVSTYQYCLVAMTHYVKTMYVMTY